MSNYSKTTSNVQKLTTMGLLCAIAYICTFIFHDIPIFPSAPFLSLDPKDAVIAIGGFIFGPVSALVMTVVVCLIETITISSTGIIGLIMNVLSTGVFAIVATFMYSKKPKFKYAIIGLIIATVSMTAVMILWNYLVTPLYMSIDRVVIVPMLPTVFLPFNLLKGCLNSALTLFLYKAVVTALQKAKLLPRSTAEKTSGSKKNNLTLMVTIGSLVVLITCLLIIFVIKGII